MNELTIIENQMKGLTEDVGKVTTLDLSNHDNQIKLYNSLQKCDVKLFDIKGQVIEFIDYFVEKSKVNKTDDKGNVIVNAETGEIEQKTKYKVILYGVDGTTYVSTAYGVFSSLSSIVSIFGAPSVASPIKVRVENKDLGNNKSSLILLLTNE